MTFKLKLFKVKKTFGVDVLLKLTKANKNYDIETYENFGNYTFNVSEDELSKTVNETLENHSIYLTVN